MAGWIFLAMLAIPFLEVVVFIEVGSRIGLPATLAVIILTAVIGTTLLRIQGLGVLNRVRASLARGEMPVDEVFDGLCLMIAGIVLLTPGFVTDAIGALLFVPAVRRLLRWWIARRIVVSGVVRVEGGVVRSDGPVQIEGEYTDVSDREKNGKEASE
ncbi:MAG: FxsA family protein [Deltaproteobacteria bacterium]|nr:FxsA family protein [Deltaproteobacteria bacterium]